MQQHAVAINLTPITTTKMLRKYAYRQHKIYLYIQFYDENMQELCGTDNYLRVDGRMTKDRIFEEFRAKAKRQKAAYERDPKLYTMNKWYYMQLFRGACPSRASKITEIVPVFE